MKTTIGTALLGLAILAAPFFAQASVNPPANGTVPEPGVLGLLGLGAAVAIAVAIGKRRR